MAIALGNIEIADLRLGESQVKALYLGSEQVWGGEEPGPAADWLCFTATQANSTVRLDKKGSPAAISLETSTDGSAWTDYSWTGSTGDTLTLANVGDKVYFRAKTENQTIGNTESDRYTFVMSGKIAASGNIQTLLKADGSRTDAPAYCYCNMFRDCSSLTAAASITLPATTLGTRCYQDLFGSCRYLTSAPAVLPATTLADYCYAGMFHYCYALTSAPKILATTLASSSTINMFLSCSALSSIEVALTSWANTSSWMSGVASTGTFTCPAALGTNETIQRGDYYCPTNWTVVNT